MERLTTCPLDCPDTCSLQVGVEAGRLSSVDAAPVGTGNPLTDGWICAKVRRHAERVHGPERLTTPLVRDGAKGSGRFRPLDWDDALDLVADRITDTITRHGPAAVVPYTYNSSAGARADRLTGRMFRRLGASRVEHTICAATAHAAWETTFPGMASADAADIAHSDLVVVWGANPSVSNTHLTPLLVDARRRGAAVVVVDPRRTPTAARADVHLPVRPGTDVVLALAVAAELDRLGLVDAAFCANHAEGHEEFRRAAAEWSVARAAGVCGLDVGDVRRLAELVGTRRPGLLRLGWGLERNRNGGAAIRAALALWVLAGQFGRPGAGVLGSTSDDTWSDDTGNDGTGDDGTGRGPTRVLNMNRIGRDLLDADPPIHLLWVQGANPAVTAPDQVRVLRGLERTDLFTVVHDQVLTDTAALADVVLPATTHFETDDVAVSYGASGSGRMPAVIDRVGESWSNDELAAALAGRLDLGDWDARAGTGIPLWQPTRPDGTVQFGPPDDPATTIPVGGRARLVDPDGADRLPTHRPVVSDLPLTLLTPASSRMINSMFAETSPARAEVAIHPDEAAARDLVDGERVAVTNALAEVVLCVRLDASVRPGVAVIPKGLWRRHVDGGLTANALIADDVEPTVGGACFNDTRVQVARVADAGTGRP